MAVLLVPACFAVLWTGFWVLSRDARYAAGAAGVLSLIAAVSTTLTAGAAWVPRLTPRRRLNVIVVSWSLLPAALVALILVAWGWSVAAVVGCTVAAGLVTGLTYARLRGQVAALQPVFVLSVDTLSDAELLRAATEQPDDDPRLSASHKAIQRLNHARALTFLAMRNGDFDRLITALPLLQAIVQDRELEPAVALLAARELVEAHNLLVEYGGDSDRFRESIGLFAWLVRENPGISGAEAVLHEYQADYQQYLMTQASEDAKLAQKAGNRAAADQAERRMQAGWDTVEQELAEAVRLTPERAEVTPQYLTELGLHLCSAVGLPGSGPGPTRGWRCADERSRYPLAGPVASGLAASSCSLRPDGPLRAARRRPGRCGRSRGAAAPPGPAGKPNRGESTRAATAYLTALRDGLRDRNDPGDGDDWRNRP